MGSVQDEHPARLGDIAHGRSGDKGNHANVAVIAYTPAAYELLREHLTPALVRKYFHNLGPSRVVRYEAPNLLALNFVLFDVLAGGASRSLRSDSQGKTLALALLELSPDDLGVQFTASCPNCGQKMLLRRGKSGVFLGCSSYPHCRKAIPLSKSKDNP
jgi:hypothetical protein